MQNKLPTFAQFSAANHNGVMPCAEYMQEQSRVIGDYFLRGNSALDSRASDETCAYCHLIALL